MFPCWGSRLGATIEKEKIRGEICCSKNQSGQHVPMLELSAGATIEKKTHMVKFVAAKTKVANMFPFWDSRLGVTIEEEEKNVVKCVAVKTKVANMFPCWGSRLGATIEKEKIPGKICCSKNQGGQHVPMLGLSAGGDNRKRKDTWRNLLQQKPRWPTC